MSADPYAALDREIDSFDEASLERFTSEIGPLRLPTQYCPYEPTPKQEYFLRCMDFEAFFGGSAGGGKSIALLMSALQFVDVPDYHALILRPTLGEFGQSGGLIDVAHEWLDLTDARWNGGTREWSFPSGATVRFGYLRNTTDLGQYKGPSYSYCAYDELTSFTEPLYRGMFRVLRQKIGVLDNVPLRMRSTSNPGSIGHQWVKSRFVDEDSRAEGVVYVPAKIADNPYLDREVYMKTLSHMSPVDRERLMNGDWDVMEEGGKFHRDDFKIIKADEAPAPLRSVRYWDLAATEASQSNPDPDFTCGLLLDLCAGGHYVIRHIVHGRFKDDGVERAMRATAEVDGVGVDVYVEQEPGAAGKLFVSYIKREVLPGYAVYAGLPRGGNKEVRARPVAAKVADGLVSIVSGEHLLVALDQFSMFPNASHDDIVDALSGAHTKLAERPAANMRTYNPNRTGRRIMTAADRFGPGHGI